MVRILQAVLAAMVLFGAGFVTGQVSLKAYQQRQSRPTPSSTVQKGPTPWLSQRAELVRRMEREFGLSAGQKQQIDSILDDSRDRLRRMWEPIAPQWNAETGQTQARIREILTPEQRLKFEELLNKSSWRRQDSRRKEGESNSPSLKPKRDDSRENPRPGL